MPYSRASFDHRPNRRGLKTSTRLAGAFRSGAGQRGQYLGGVLDEAEMTFARTHREFGARDVVAQPLSVGRWAKAVFVAVPEEHRAPDGRDIDFPGADPCDVVPPAAVRALPQRLAHAVSQRCHQV